MTRPITIFISYAHKDASYLQELETFLKPYSRKKTIEVWTDKDIVAGQKWDELIKTKLDESEIILFLVSPDLLASDYIDGVEIRNAIANESIAIIPVIIRPIDMSLLQLNYLQVVPTGAKPVSEWSSRDKAWNDVLASLKEVFEKINKKNPDESVGSTVRTNYSLRKGSVSTDDLIKWFFVFLIAVCIGVFIYGVIEHDNYYYFTSLGGMGFGFLAYFLLHRRFSH